jgi:predicted Zn-dependent protease
LAALAAQTSLESRLAGQSGAEPARWLSTHPASGERVARIRTEAKTLVPRAGARALNRDGFLNAIDGMPYDDDAAQGVVQGRSFRHAGLGLALDAPPGVNLRNGATAVTATAENGASFDLRLADGRTSLDQIAAARWQTIGAQPQPMQPTRINGLEAIVGSARANTRQGPVAVGLTVVRWSAAEALSILTVAPDGQAATMQPLVGSLRRLSPAEAAAIRTRRIQVVRVAASDTLASLAARMAYDDDRMARFLTLNQLDANSTLKPGDRVKLVVWR